MVVVVAVVDVIVVVVIVAVVEVNWTDYKVEFFGNFLKIMTTGSLMVVKIMSKYEKNPKPLWTA